MFVTDIEKEFYKVISGKKLLIFVNFDIDGLCGCKILQTLFHSDNILYSLRPVEGIRDLKEAYSNHCEQTRYVLMINCGAAIDIVETLNPKEDVIFFVIDSHRPIDVCNIYSSGQVRLMIKPEDEEGIPEFNDIFLEDESDSEEEGEVEGSENEVEENEPVQSRANKLKMTEQKILKRRQKRLWKERRDKIMFEYTQFSYFGRSCAMDVFEMIWHLGKDSLDSLWWAMVGVTHQATLGLVQEELYTKELPVLQLHMSRLMKNNVEAGSSQKNNPVPQLKISSQKDLRLALYRHWTVESSLKNSEYTTIKLRLWTMRGQKKLFQLLAQIGLPLRESRQKFNAMESSLRGNFISMMEQAAEIYNLDNLVYPSFTLSYGYRKSYQASDYVYGLLGLMEPSVRNISIGSCFSDALDALSRSKNEVLTNGIELSKGILKCVFKHTQLLIDMNQIMNAGPFLYFVLQEGALDVRMFGHAHGLGMLAKATLQAFHSENPDRRMGNLPLIASAPTYPSDGSCILLGVPPVLEILPRNFFGKAFSQAAEVINIEPHIYFESAAIKIRTNDRLKFLDALSSMLS